MEKLINIGSKPTKDMLIKSQNSLGSEYKTLALQLMLETDKAEAQKITERMNQIDDKLLIIEDLLGDL